MFWGFRLGHALRATGLHFFDIFPPKSSPRMICVERFDLDMCFGPQGRAIFRHADFQKWSISDMFLTCLFQKVLRTVAGSRFLGIPTSNNAPSPSFFLTFLTWKSVSRHNGVQFFVSHLGRWLRTGRFNEPACRPSPTNLWTNAPFRGFRNTSRTGIFFLLGSSFRLFLFLSLPLAFCAFLLCFHVSMLSEVLFLVRDMVSAAGATWKACGMKSTSTLPGQWSGDQSIFCLNLGNTGKLWVPTDNTFEQLGFEGKSGTSSIPWIQIRIRNARRQQERCLVNSYSPKSSTQLQKPANHFQVGGRKGGESNYRRPLGADLAPWLNSVWKGLFWKPFQFRRHIPPDVFFPKVTDRCFSWRQAATNIATANCHQRIPSRNIPRVRASTCTVRVSK